jgi:cytochrome c553
MKPLLLILAASTVFATPIGHAEDAETGRQLVYTCTGCHGVTGYKNAYPNYHVPKIAGQNKDYLVAALKSYQRGERKHPTMRAQGEGLSDQDIEQVASYLSSLSGGAQ